MKNIKNIIYISMIALLSCKTSSETRVANVKSSGNISNSGIIYALPKTTLRFVVEATRTDIVPGPYYEFAGKYMGIEDAPKNETTTWQISDIAIDTYNEIDPEHYYILQPSGIINVDFKRLIENGSILPVNSLNAVKFKNEFYGKGETGHRVVFTDLSVSKYVGEEQVTYYKRIQRDSIQAKIPVVKKQSVYKSFEDKAEEAANFIFTLREKRFELLTGMADFYPEGKSLEVAIKELNRLENDYLELFIGKTFTSSYTVSFEFSPEEASLNHPNILFRFNEEKGVLAANDLSGRPIIVELTKKGLTNNLSYLFSDQINREGTAYKDKLYYRIPDVVDVQVFDSKALLANGKASIAQYGIAVPFPAMFLMEDEGFIKFYREETKVK